MSLSRPAVVYDVGEQPSADNYIFLSRERPSIPEYSLQHRRMPFRPTIMKVAGAVVRYFPGVVDFLRDFVRLADRHAEL